MMKKRDAQNGGTPMDEKTIALILSILAKGDRVELIPVKDGVKIIRIERKEVKIPTPRR